MAVDYHDRESGFRHREVIRFINREVLMNGGGPEFYVAFRSQPWTEVEDRLSTVVVDSQVPRSIKRACAWSALALSVRATARQWEQQARQVLSLQEKMEEQEELSLAKTAELQRLREKHEEAKKQLHSTRAALEQAQSKRNILHGQLLQTERSTQGVPLPLYTVPQLEAQPQGAEGWTLNADQYGNTMAMGAQGWLHGESPMVGTAPMAYMPRPPNPFTPVIQHPLPMPGPQPFPFHAPHPVAPVVGTGAESTATPLQMPPQEVYQPHLCAPMGFQAHMTPLWNQRCYGQGECLYIPQGTAPLGNSKFNSQEESPKRSQETGHLGNNSSLHQEEGPVRSQETGPGGHNKSHCQEEGPVGSQNMAPLGDNSSLHQEKGPVRSQETVPLGDNRSHSLEEGPVKSQETGPGGDNKSHSQEEGPVRSQNMGPLGDDSSLHQKEGPVRSQETGPGGDNSSLHQEKGPVRSQETVPLGDSKSHDVRENSKKQKPQGQKAEPPNGKKASKSQQWEKPAPGSQITFWKCRSCGGKNFSWRTVCYKCKEVYKTDDSGDLDPGQAPH